MTAARGQGAAAQLAALADHLEEQLGDELASRQAIAEHAAGQVRAIAARMVSVRDAPSDPRVIAAREFLASARTRKPGGLDRDQLVREAAELRRLLGQALDVLHGLDILDALGALDLAPVPRTRVLADGSATLSPADLTEALGALDHAETLMRERAAAWCEDCAVSPAGACEACLDQLDQADKYHELGHRLGAAR